MYVSGQQCFHSRSAPWDKGGATVLKVGDIFASDGGCVCERSEQKKFFHPPRCTKVGVNKKRSEGGQKIIFFQLFCSKIPEKSINRSFFPLSAVSLQIVARGC